MTRCLPVLLIALFLGACASENVFVLLPDEDGGVGAIEVSNASGSQRIDQPRQATRVAAETRAPAAPETLSETEIVATWGAALRASAPQPRTFILYFELGSDSLTPESQAQLPSIKASIRDFPAPEIAVTGHTDRVGKEDYNARLALQRANLIRDMLVAEGLDTGLIEVSSHGEGNPLVPTPDETPEPRNRRVEVTVR